MLGCFVYIYSRFLVHVAFECSADGQCYGRYNVPCTVSTFFASSRRNWLLGAHHRRSFMMLNVPVVELSRCGVRILLIEEHPGASRTNNHKECKNGSRYCHRESSQPWYEEIADIHAIKQASNLISA